MLLFSKPKKTARLLAGQSVCYILSLLIRFIPRE
jgi:hypothetical protein